MFEPQALRLAADFLHLKSKPINCLQLYTYACVHWAFKYMTHAVLVDYKFNFEIKNS